MEMQDPAHCKWDELFYIFEFDKIYIAKNL